MRPTSACRRTVDVERIVGGRSATGAVAMWCARRSLYICARKRPVAAATNFRRIKIYVSKGSQLSERSAAKRGR